MKWIWDAHIWHIWSLHIPSLFPVAWIPWDLPPAWVPVSILSVSILISWGGAAEHGAQNPGISTCTALPLPQRHFAMADATVDVSTMRLLQCLELSMNQHSHWNIWSRVCVPSSNLGSCAPYFPLKMSWHKPEATARVLGEVGGLHFCAWSKFKFTHTKNLDTRGTRAEYLLLTTSHKYVLKKCKERL